MEIENTIFKAHPTMFRSRPVLFVFFVMLAAGTWGIGLILLVIWFLRVKGETLVVTTTRSIYRSGILAKRTTEVRHVDVRNLQVSQGFLQRIFGVGSLAISSSGQGGLEIEISGIVGPHKAADIIRGYQGQ